MVHDDLTHLVVLILVVGKTNPADEVGTHEGKDDDPEAQEDLAVQDVPAVGQVGHAEELQGKGQFQEAQAHLDAVHPVAALGSTLQHRGEHGEEREGQGQGQGKAEHTHRGGYDAAARAHLYQQETDDGTRAAEAYQAQGEGHEEDAQQPRCLVGLTIYGVTPAGGECQFETSQERGGKDHQHEAEEDVEDGIRGEGVQGTGTESQGDEQPQQDVDDHNAQTIGHGIAYAFLAVILAALEEETHRHGDDGPYAGSEQGQQTACQTQQEDGHETLV